MYEIRYINKKGRGFLIKVDNYGDVIRKLKYLMSQKVSATVLMDGKVVGKVWDAGETNGWNYSLETQ